MRRLVPIAIACALVAAIVGCVREVSLAPTPQPDAANFVPDADFEPDAPGFTPDAPDVDAPPGDAAVD